MSTPPRLVWLEPGERVTLEMPYSEVCMHMQVAGTRMQVELTGRGGAQLYTLDGKQFSMPILPGEAGLYRDGEHYYAYPDGI